MFSGESKRLIQSLELLLTASLIFRKTRKIRILAYFMQWIFMIFSMKDEHQWDFTNLQWVRSSSHFFQSNIEHRSNMFANVFQILTVIHGRLCAMKGVADTSIFLL